MILYKKAVLSQGNRTTLPVSFVDIQNISLLSTLQAPQYFDFYFRSTFTCAQKSTFSRLFHLEFWNDALEKLGIAKTPSCNYSQKM